MKKLIVLLLVLVIAISCAFAKPRYSATIGFGPEILLFEQGNMISLPLFASIGYVHSDLTGLPFHAKATLSLPLDEFYDIYYPIPNAILSAGVAHRTKFNDKLSLFSTATADLKITPVFRAGKRAASFIFSVGSVNTVGYSINDNIRVTAGADIKLSFLLITSTHGIAKKFFMFGITPEITAVVVF